jgi:hypothetical protein
MLVEYFNVVKDRESLERMLEYTNGQKLVPVIVEGSRVRVGYDGGS